MKKTVRILSLIALVAIVFACKKDDKTEPKPAPEFCLKKIFLIQPICQLGFGQV